MLEKLKLTIFFYSHLAVVFKGVQRPNLDIKGQTIEKINFDEGIYVHKGYSLRLCEICYISIFLRIHILLFFAQKIFDDSLGFTSNNQKISNC